MSAGWARREIERAAAETKKPISFLLPARVVPTRRAPCGCKWYPDGTRYRCLSHQDMA